MISGLGLAMALQFKVDGRGGYLYRRDQIGPAIVATAAERDRYVRWMGWMVILGAILYVGGVVLMAMLAEHFVSSDGKATTTVGGVVVGLVPLTGFYLFLRWASHAPARDFVGRPELKPAKTRKQVFGRRLARMTYSRIVVVFGGMAFFMLFWTDGSPEEMLLVAGLPAAVGLGFAFWRWRIDTE